MSRLTIATALMMCFPAASVATAQKSSVRDSAWHKVTIRKDGNWVELRGTVRNIQGSTLQFESSGGLQIQSMDLQSIKHFTFTANQDSARGVTELETKNYRSAEQYFQSALQEESRDWAKAEILAQLAKALISDNRRNETLPLFQQIYKLDPASRLLGQIPLVWEESLPEQERLTLPANRLSTGNVVTRLAVASCVLHDPEYQLRAARVLKGLRLESRSPAVAQLAAGQLWRLSLLTDDDSTPILTDAWQGQWNQMPASTRPGPGLALGRCLQQLHLYDQAALVLLFSPLVQVNDPAVAASSLNRATQCLTAAGRRSESDTVYRELITRFPQSSVARQKSK